MQACFHDVAHDIRICFSEEAVHLSRYIRPLPHFHGDWKEVAKYTSIEEWEANSFYSLIGEYYQDMILWFFIDLNENRHSENTSPANDRSLAGFIVPFLLFQYLKSIV